MAHVTLDLPAARRVAGRRGELDVAVARVRDAAAALAGAATAVLALRGEFAVLDGVLGSSSGDAIDADHEVYWLTHMAEDASTVAAEYADRLPFLALLAAGRPVWFAGDLRREAVAAAADLIAREGDLRAAAATLAEETPDWFRLKLARGGWALTPVARDERAAARLRAYVHSVLLAEDRRSPGDWTPGRAARAARIVLALVAAATDAAAGV